MRKRRPAAFSATKAVKSNARDRVGTPPPSHALPNDKVKAERRASKHRVTLHTMLQQSDRD